MKEAALITLERKEGFDMGFRTIQPVIQGVADTETHNTDVQKHTAESVEFPLASFDKAATSA